MIVLAGVPLAVVLWRFPWHRFGLSIADEFRRLGLEEIPTFRPIEATALESPNAFLGRAALILTVLMVVAVIVGKLTAARTPLPAAWQQMHLIAGAAVLGLLGAKIVAQGEFVTLAAWVAVGLAGLLAYAGFIRGQEAAAAGPGPSTPASPDTPAGA
jgi:hypothetical protein